MSVKNSVKAEGVVKAIRAAAEKGVNEGAQAVVAAAIPMTPFRDGGLRDSVDIEYAERNRKRTVQATVGYYIVYAAAQHEGLPNKKQPGTRTKYLETALRDPAVQARVRNTIANHMKGKL